MIGHRHPPLFTQNYTHGCVRIEDTYPDTVDNSWSTDRLRTTARIIFDTLPASPPAGVNPLEIRVPRQGRHVPAMDHADEKRYMYSGHESS